MSTFRRRRLTLRFGIVLSVISLMAVYLISFWHNTSEYCSDDACLGGLPTQIDAALRRQNVTSSISERTCENALTDNLDIQLSDKVVKDVSDICLKHADILPYSSDPDLERLLALEAFSHVTCHARAMGPASEPRGLVALASVPGAGSSWVRHLFEQVSGITESELCKCCFYQWMFFHVLCSHSTGKMI